MENPQVNFGSAVVSGPTFKEGEWMIIKASPDTQIITAALWHNNALKIIGQSDSTELKLMVKRSFESLKGPCKLVIHWYDGAWEGIEYPFTVI